MLGTKVCKTYNQIQTGYNNRYTQTAACHNSFSHAWFTPWDKTLSRHTARLVTKFNIWIQENEAQRKYNYFDGCIIGSIRENVILCDSKVWKSAEAYEPIIITRIQTLKWGASERDTELHLTEHGDISQTVYCQAVIVEDGVALLEQQR